MIQYPIKRLYEACGWKEEEIGKMFNPVIDLDGEDYDNLKEWMDKYCSLEKEKQ